MQIEIDNHSGFCYGVVKTIELAEEALNKSRPVYCLGEIVHNEEEVKRLTSRGLIIIEHNDIRHIDHSVILIRAHGEPPSTYSEIAGQSDILKDGTCPIVLQLQKKVRQAWEEMRERNGQVVIFGKKGHAEVVGLAGQSNDTAIIVSSVDDMDSIDFTRPVVLLAQTTQPTEGFQTIAAMVRERMSEHFPPDNIPLKMIDSICRHVSKRGEYLKEFVQKHEVVVFVCGTSSSNGKVLYEICKKNNTDSHWISNTDMLKKEWFTNKHSVGISGATSTPRWLMENVAEKIKELICS
jgi:4-hydroxy-3-methylbut-2-en-1-yl diphosphate reductase